MPNVLTGVLSGTSSIIRTQPLTATENGTYNPPSGVDGYKPVVVNVQQPVIEQLTATYNGIYNAPSGVDGYDPVVVNVPAPAPVLDDITITENGHYVPPTGVDGYDDITVNVPAPAPVLDDITITANGHYTPPTGVDGYDDITVNVPLPANAYLKQTLSGLPAAVATFNGADAPLDSLKASIDSSGWSSCEITKFSKNWYITKYSGRTNQGVEYTVTNGIIHAVGEVTGANSYAVSDNSVTKVQCTLLLAGTYTFSKRVPNTIYLHLRKFIEGSSNQLIMSLKDSESGQFTIEEDSYIYVNVQIPNGVVIDADLQIQIEKNPTVTAYEPYNGNTYSIPFTDGTNPVTVYNGIIDITGGSWSGEDANSDPINGTFTPIAVRSDGVTNISVDCGEVTELKYYTQS